jgi:integrase
MASLFKAWISRKNPDGTKEKARSKKWYGQYKGADGRTVRVPLCEDREAAQAMLGEKVKRARHEQAGLIDRFDENRRTPLATHLADFETSLKARHCVEDHWKPVMSRARRVVAGCRFRFFPDISASAVEAFVGKLRREENLSPQTCNFYLQAVKQFCKWLVEDGRMPTSPLAHLKRSNVKVDQRRRRRELSADELSRLLAATEAGGVCSKLSGPDRAMLYRVALSTGLRAAELGSLTPESFDLISERPTVTIEAENEKARRGAELPLPDSLVVLLATWLAGKASDKPLWPGLWSKQKRGASMMRHDLEAARKAWLEEAKDDPREQEARQKSDFLCYLSQDGEQADFHALRHTFLSRLGRSGATPKELQLMARHATVEITLTRYCHASMLDLSSAVNRIPALTAEARPVVLRPTGS